MSYKIALPEELLRKQASDNLLSEAKRIKKSRALSSSLAGASVGIVGAFVLPESVKQLSFEEDEEGGSLPLALILGVAGAGIGFGGQVLLDKMTFRKKKADLRTKTLALMVSAREDVSSLGASYEAIFSSYVDGFVAETRIYESTFDLLKAQALSDESVYMDYKDQIEEVSDRIATIEDQLMEMATLKKEVPIEETVSNVDLPVFPGSGPSEEKLKKAFAKELTEKRQEMAELEEKALEETKLRSKVAGELKSAESSQAEYIGEYSRCIANRKARDFFKAYFIDGMLSIYNDVSKLYARDINSTIDVIQQSKEFESLKEYKQSLEVNYQEFVDDVDGHVKESLSTSNRIKSKGKGINMNYSAAPFWKIFQTFVDPSVVEASCEYKEALAEIIAGATHDFEHAHEKGTWIAIRNYADAWLFTVGEFSEVSAKKLSNYLSEELDGEALTVKSDLAKVNKAYKVFAKKAHSDVSEESKESADLVIAEVSTLMKAFRKYHENYNHIFGGVSNGISSETKV